MTRTTIRRASVNVLILAGALAYVAGMVAIALGADYTVKGPLFELAAASWFLAWVLHR